jgi:nicotinamide-nucleotide amidase
MTPNPPPLVDVQNRVQALIESLATALLARRWGLATAESCTGGLIAASCTERAGSSTWFERGYVTYSNASKAECLGVPMAIIESEGAVSEPVARAMAQGALLQAQAQVAVAVTGIAGPDGGSETKPVGTVWVSWAFPEHIASQCFHFAGDRALVRWQTVEAALEGLQARLGAETNG